MLEFALVLPILLMLIYGLFEVGRVIFIYSSVTTASREAVRYGSTTGLNEAGTVFRYQDCKGIRQAAKDVGFLADIQDSDIEIDFYHGVYEPFPFATCPQGLDEDTTIKVKSGDRIKVMVSAPYSPVVPIVPISPRNIIAYNYRTYLGSIAIEITSYVIPTNTPTSTVTSTPTLTPTNTSTPTITSTPTRTPTATNTPLLSPTPSRTPTSTVTPTKTTTASPTSTSTNTLTPTSTATPTNTATQTASPISCDVRHSTLSLGSQTLTWTIYNNSVYTITISQDTLYWPTTSQTLNNVTFSGTTIWNIGSDKSPTTINSNWLGALSNRQLTPSSNKVMVFNFGNDFPEGVTVSSFRVLVNFVENGCPILDSDNTHQLP